MRFRYTPWYEVRGVQWLIGLAVCAVVATLTFFIVTRAGQSRAPDPQWRSPELGTLAAIGQQRRVTARDAGELVEGFEASEELAVSRTALATIADLLGRDDVRMDERIRRQLESVLIGALSHDQWRIRSTALAGCSAAGLVARPEVRTRVVAMRKDPSAHIAQLARNIIDELESDRSEGGG